jgi:ubiquitin thioesterase OTU1
MDTRCIVVYSGIHYDRIAFAMDLGQKLREQHYFTDTTDFIITCQVCGWVGEGTKGAATHIKETGHSEFVETKIT